MKLSSGMLSRGAAAGARRPLYHGTRATAGVVAMGAAATSFAPAPPSSAVMQPCARRVGGTSRFAVSSSSSLLFGATRVQLASASTTTTTTPPAWVDSLRAAAKATEKNISYDIKIYNDMAFRRQSFQFKKEAWDPHTMSNVLRKKLCLGDELAEYTLIGEAFPFPDREDSPVINEPQFPCKLYWDHNAPTEKIMIQLSEHFPPLLWITVKPTLEALRRVFSEFITVDADHMKKYLPYYEKVQNDLETADAEKFGDSLSNTRMKDRFIEDMRKKDPRTVDPDWDREHNVFIGTVDHFRLAEDKFMKHNPFVFGWPLLVGDGNHHLEGTPFRMAAFRTVFSKSVIMLTTRLDMQVDHRQAQLTVADDPEVLLEIPLFASVTYPTNTRMCGGAALVQRYNTVMGTTYPPDTPVDVLAAFARETTVKSASELLEDLAFLEAASNKTPDIERVVRLSQDMLSSNRILGQLAYTIVYLAVVGYDKFIEDTFARFSKHPSDIIRVACAKGAHVFGRADLIETMVAAEEPGSRTRTMIERCAVAVPADDAAAAAAAGSDTHGDTAPQA